jgi:post-segregation antitoxin (ccd killing protein)
MKKLIIVNHLIVGMSAVAAFFLTGCTANKDNVLAVTGTVIGVQIHQKDTDKTPELKVGYARTEFAYVPTDKRSDTNAPGGSAANSAEVLMEINAQGNVGLGTAYQGGVYQRLAVGKTAVSQPGAAYMMAKDSGGNIDPATAQMVSEAIRLSAAEAVTIENDEAAALAKAADDGTGKVKPETLDKLVKGTLLEGKVGKYYGASPDALKAKLTGSWRPFIRQMMDNNK